LGAPHHVSSGLEIAIGDMKQAMPFDHEFAGMFQLLIKRGNRARRFGRRHDPAPVSALINSALVRLSLQSPTPMLADRSQGRCPSRTFSTGD